MSSPAEMWGKMDRSSSRSSPSLALLSTRLLCTDAHTAAPTAAMDDSPPRPIANLAVVLLLGGRSTRMGSPKHLLEHPATRRPLYQHHLDSLCELESEGVFPAGVVVSARADQRDQLELSEVRLQLARPFPGLAGDELT